MSTTPDSSAGQISGPSPTGRFRPYPRYKSSPEWSGEIPAHWEVKRLKRVASLVDEKLAEKPVDATYVGLENIESGSGSLLPGEVANVDSAVNVFRRGDVLFGKLRPYLAKAVEAPFGGVCSTELVVLRPKAEAHGRFLRYELLSEGVIQRITADTYGVKMPRASPEQVGQLAMAAPPMAEQKAIAAFLDRETAKIDGLIAKKERLIELLEEKRAALISQGVTRGLNPSVPMRESGVEWLERIPEHWKVLRLAMAADTITNGYVGPTRDILVQDGVRYLQSLHIKNGEVHFDKPYYVRENWSHEHQKSVLRRGDLVIVQTGDVGQCCAIPEAFDGSNCHALIIVRLKRGLGSGFFLSAYLRSDPGRNELLRAQTGALHPHLECGKVREIRVALPPVEEQDEIMRFIDGETARIDGLVAKIQEAIEKLLEYRTALISSAVTGKIDVRSASNAGGSALQTSIQD